jgi:hypothetical protein
MLRARAIRERLVDFLIREPEHKIHPEWSNFVRHLMTAATPEILFCALYRVVKPAQLKCYELHESRTLDVNDAPTKDLLAERIPSLRRELAWGEACIARWGRRSGSRAGDSRFEKALRAHLLALGGPMGIATSRRRVAKYPEWKRPDDMALEARFEIQSADRYTNDNWPKYDAIPSAYVHFTELPVIDICGSIVYDGRAHKLPFQYFEEFTRQTWDEARHCEMGMERLKAFGVDPYKVPVPTGHYTNFAAMTLLHRLASLTQVGEACSFAPKREWVAKAWQRNDPLSALEHEYDILDERTHVTFGARWLKTIMDMTSEKRSVKQVVQDADWECRERGNQLRKAKGEKWQENLGERFMGCGTNTSPISLAPALDGIPNIIA